MEAKMAKDYEFAYQSTKQKLILIGLKLLVAGAIGLFLYSIAWPDQLGLDNKLSLIGCIFIGFWIYANLSRVRIEVQELFVEPIDLMHTAEFMFIGVALQCTRGYK